MSHWTYKTLRFNADGQTCEWHVLPFRFPIMAGAVMAASAYMLAEAERGHMVVVSLEPSDELKPLVERAAEHSVMLDELKRIHALTKWDDLATLIYDIDPAWQMPKESR